jgi:hypothetical protein
MALMARPSGFALMLIAIEPSADAGGHWFIGASDRAPPTYPFPDSSSGAWLCAGWWIYRDTRCGGFCAWVFGVVTGAG